MQTRQLIIGASVVTATILAAVLLGVGAGNLLAEKKQHDIRKLRAAFTDQLLSQMENLKIGDTLPNISLVDLDRNVHPLRGLITRPSLLVFFDYSCENCLTELEHLGRTIRDSAQGANILLVSASNPLYLLDIRKEHSLVSPILYDDHEQLINALGITTYPFNLYVSPGGRIDSTIASPLGALDFEQFLQSSTR